MKGFSKRIASLGSFLVELVLYAGFVAAYYFLVLHLLGGLYYTGFDDNKTLYAILALTLIGAQGSLLEMLTRGLLRVIRRTEAIIPALRRLARPHETIIRPPNAPGLLIYRFAGPLLFFNTTHFTNRVHELVHTADPPVIFSPINAEAIVDMDMTGVEVLESLNSTLQSKNITLGLSEVKGHFREMLLSAPPLARILKIYPSVTEAVRELSTERPTKEREAGGV